MCKIHIWGAAVDEDERLDPGEATSGAERGGHSRSRGRTVNRGAAFRRETSASVKV